MRIENEKKQKNMMNVYSFVKDYIERNNISPSFTEIRDGCKIKSTETVRRYLMMLENEGYINIKKIQTINMVARGITVIK